MFCLPSCSCFTQESLSLMPQMVMPPRWAAGTISRYFWKMNLYRSAWSVRLVHLMSSSEMRTIRPVFLRSVRLATIRFLRSGVAMSRCICVPTPVTCGLPFT